MRASVGDGINICRVVLWPFARRIRRNLIASSFRKPSQQRQDDDAEDGKDNHFREDVQQKRHLGPPLRVVAVCRSSIGPIVLDPVGERVGER